METLPTFRSSHNDGPSSSIGVAKQPLGGGLQSGTSAPGVDVGRIHKNSVTGDSVSGFAVHRSFCSVPVCAVNQLRPHYPSLGGFTATIILLSFRVMTLGNRHQTVNPWLRTKLLIR